MTSRPVGLRQRVPWLALGILLAALVIPLASLVVYHQEAAQIGLGALAGVPTSILVAWLLLRLQEPRLVATLEEKGTFGNKDTYWLHVRVENVTLGLLGGGMAHDVTAKLGYEGSTARRQYDLKWSSKQEPIGLGLVQTPQGPALATSPNPALFEQAKLETIRPGRNRDLGVGFKMQGDSDFYVFEPESYAHRDWKNPDCRYGPGTHRFALTLEYDGGRAKPLNIEVENDATPDKTSVRAGVLKTDARGISAPPSP